MRIAVMVNYDLYSCMALNFLAPFLQNHTVWLGCSSHVGKTDASAPAPHPMLQTLRFHEQTLPMHTLFPKLEAANSRGAWLTTRQLAQTHQWPLTMIERLDTPGLLEEVQAFAPDVMVSIRFGKIFKGPWITLARHGILNLHSGLLPEYRGVLATFWTLLQQRSEYGCTLHWIEDGTIDTGGTLARITLPTVPGKSLMSHILALYEPGMQAMTQALQSLAQGQRPVAQAQSGQAQYFSYPTAQDIEHFYAQGGTALDYADYTHILRQFGAS